MEENFEKSSEESFPIPGYKNSKSYAQDALCSILAAIKASNALPSAGDDADFYRSFEGFRKVMRLEGKSILSLMSSLLLKQNIRESFQGRELEEKFDLLVEVNEVILDNISNCLDEACGLRKSEEELVLAVKPQSSISTSWNKKQFNSPSSQSYKLLAAKNITRPQLSFKDKIDNSNSPFVPIIKYKPNSIKPLAITVEKDNDREEFCHPYEWEIEKFDVSEKHLQEVEPAIPKPLDETPCIFIKTEEELKNLCNELKQQSEFAVDLEHHSYRSFQGFTCLMQISTREKDYIIDVIDLRSELHILNEVFTDPKIVKVLHGADMDVQWLQRDFGIYIVNMFDTGQAARVLHFAHLSLSYLLKHYCKLDLDKQFQLADWRIRPLPNEMIKYARQDTHYLLYVYDCLKRDLIKNGNETKNLLRSTFERSKIICLKKYQKPFFSEDKYIELYKKTKKILNSKQLFCLKELYSWRDKIARETDESVAYVLPNHMLLQIAEVLPREQQGILACCNPVPPLVKQQLNELHSIVLKANDSSLKELALLGLQKKGQNNSAKNQIDLTTDLVRCSHDILHAEEKKLQASDSTNTALPLVTKKDAPVVYLRKEPTLTALFDNLKQQIKKNSSQFCKVSDMLSKLYSPYQRYQMTEQLQMNAEAKNSNTVKNKVNETENAATKRSNTVKDKVDETQNSCEDNTEQDFEEDCQIIAKDNLFTTCVSNISDYPASKSRDEIFSSTPLRKKSNKKNKRKFAPDVSLSTTPNSSAPPPKKSKTPEVIVIDEDNFKPYDYSQTNLNDFSGKKKSKDTFKPEMQHNFRGPGKHFGRNKKHFKEGTFSDGNKQAKKKWPQKN